MGDVLEVLGGLSAVVKMGWLVFFAWTLTQILWYRRARVVPAAVPVKPPRKRSGSASGGRSAAHSSSDPETAAADGGSADFLASLGLLQSPAASQYGVPMSSRQAGPSIIN